jgi:hypothetical protein
MTARVIETEYRGYRFRSRLEARWAVFFDTLGVSWVYEPEGYDLDGLWYLPDFYVSTWGAFVEIKRGNSIPTPEERAKCLALARMTGRYCFLIFGTPGVDSYRMYVLTPWTREPDADPLASDTSEPEEAPYQYPDWENGLHWVFAECGKCDGLNLACLADTGGDDLQGASSLPPCGNPHRCMDRAPFLHSGPLPPAYDAARAARFGVHDTRSTRHKRGKGGRHE